MAASKRFPRQPHRLFSLPPRSMRVTSSGRGRIRRGGRAVKPLRRWESDLRPGAAASVAARRAAEIRRGTETHHPTSGNAHRLARARIPGNARLAAGGTENPESPQYHPVATLQGGAQTLEQGLHGLPRNRTWEVRGVHRPGEEVSLHHGGRIVCDTRTTCAPGARGKVRKRRSRPETRPTPP